MFTAAANHLAREFGRDCLTPTPSMNKSDEIRLFNLVVKHKKRFFWQSKCRLEPSSIPISAVLRETVGNSQAPPVAWDELTTRKDLGQYSFRTSIKMKGKLSVAFLRDFLAELSGGNSLKCHANFSKLEKLYVSDHDIGQALENQFLDLENDTIKNLQKGPSRVLCMVTGVIRAGENVKFVRHSTLTELGKIKASVSGDVANINIEENVDRDKNDVLEIPAKTNLVYYVVELKIRDDGSIGVCMFDDDKGGFDSTDDTLLVEDNEKSLFFPPEEVATIRNKTEIQEALIECIEFPILLEKLLDIFYIIHDGKTESWDKEFWRLVGEDGFKAAHSLFKLIKVDFKHGEAIDARDVDKDMLGCLLYYLELFSFMYDDEINAIKYCSFEPHLAPSFLKVFRDTLTGKPIEKTSMMPLLKFEWALDFLSSLGYKLNDIQKTDTVITPEESVKAIEAAGKLLYGLFILPVQ